MDASNQTVGECHSSRRKRQFIIVLCFLLVEVGVWCVLIPFYQTTAKYVFSVVCTCVGALLRFYISKWLNGTIPSFFLGTFLCNVVGSCIATGVKVALRNEFSLTITSLLSSLSTGLASALTTMSTFAKETNGLKRQSFPSFLLYSFASLLLSFAVCCILFALFA